MAYNGLKPLDNDSRFTGHLNSLREHHFSEQTISQVQQIYDSLRGSRFEEMFYGVPILDIAAHNTWFRPFAGKAALRSRDADYLRELAKLQSLFSEEHEEKTYNPYLQETYQQSLAGYNPNLSPSDASFEASENDNPLAGYDPSSEASISPLGDALSTAGSVVGGVSGIFSTVFGIASIGSRLSMLSSQARSSSLSADGLELQNAQSTLNMRNSMSNLASGYLVDAFSGYDAPLDDSDLDFGMPVLDASRKVAVNYNPFGKDSKFHKPFQEEMDRQLKSLRTNRDIHNLRAQQKMASSLDALNGGVPFYSESDDVMKHYYKPILEHRKATFKLQEETLEFMADYKKRYSAILNPYSSANALNKQNELSSAQSEYGMSVISSRDPALEAEAGNQQNLAAIAQAGYSTEYYENLKAKAAADLQNARVNFEKRALDIQLNQIRNLSDLYNYLGDKIENGNMFQSLISRAVIDQVPAMQETMQRNGPFAQFNAFQKVVQDALVDPINFGIKKGVFFDL